MKPGQRKRGASRTRSADRPFDSASAAWSAQQPAPYDPLLAEITSWTREPEWIRETELIRDAWHHEASWEGVLPLRPAEIRLRSRWRAALTRKVLWGLSRRHATMAGVMATFILTAACASAVKTMPNQISVAANTPAAIPYSRTSHAMRIAAAERTAADRLIAPTATEAEFAPPAAPSQAIASNEGASNDNAVPARDEPQANEAQPNEAQPNEAQNSVAAPSHEESEGQGPSLFHQTAPQAQPLTKLVAFSSAPFPYHGASPSGGPFLNTRNGSELGHRTRRGAVLWESKTFGDSRVLVHVPAGFDPSRPAAMVIFFHGYGATLPRDVALRQKVPAQISASGANVVLVAPQFAVDARDPSIGHFWEQGGFNRFLGETAKKLASMQGDPALESTFAHMPIVMVAYSGGFYPAAWCIKDLGDSHRVRGILMLDAVYGEFERYADWAAANRSSFLVSAYTHYTSRQNAALRSLLAARGVPTTTTLARKLTNGGTFLPAEFPHQDYVTRAYTEDPIKDILTRLPEYRIYDPQAVAAMDGPVTTASIH